MGCYICACIPKSHIRIYLFSSRTKTFYISFQANLPVPFAFTFDFLSTSFGVILQLSASNKLQSALTQLASFKMLSRFVIDEAHCISQVRGFAIMSAPVAPSSSLLRVTSPVQWGHDFRPDYKRLSQLPERFPGVPIMALTATATPRVQMDILHQLRIKDPKWWVFTYGRTLTRPEWLGCTVMLYVVHTSQGAN